MGRAKLNMELIRKEKSRNITFKKRKEGLVRKLHEFTTLCDVDACMIIYGPKQENGPVEPEIWPQNLNEVRRMVDIYNSKKKDSGNKTFGLSDFFHERKRKIEDELSKLRKRNLEARYPTPVKLLYCMNEGQLREFALALSNKAEVVKAKIEELKRSASKQDITAGLNGQFYPPINDMNVPIYHPTLDHYQQMHSINHNSTMMLMMNGGDQFGGASSSNGANIQFSSSFKQQIFYENRRAMPMTLYYAPPPPPPPQYMMAPPQLPFSAGWENKDEDMVRYDHMKN